MPGVGIVKGVDIELHFGQKTILGGVSFSFREQEVIGVVGKNGSGKSSLLKLLTRQIQPDSGNLEFKNGITVDYVAQEFELEDDLSVFETIAKKWFLLHQHTNIPELVYVADIIDQNEPWKLLNIELHEIVYTQIIDIIRSLDCPYADQKISTLSGGEKRKVAIASALFAAADLLILDEPTNHLDIPSIEKLEARLKLYPGTIIVVSHDRYFLDNLVTRMIEVYDSKLYDHNGNYQDYLVSKATRLQIAGVQEDRKQAFLKREVEWVRAGVKARGTKDKGRLQRFYDLKNDPKFSQDQTVELLLPQISPLGNKIIDIENVSIALGQKRVISDFSFSFQAGVVLGIVGANGSGKTTLIKAILGDQALESGRIKIGLNTQFNYQDQEKWNLDLESTPFQEIANSQESTTFGEGTTNSRAYLRRYLFDNQQIMTPIKFFSGGERARILLAKLLKQPGNCLILDEPTNDLDLDTIRLLEESLLAFEGVSIVVSHDRYFLNRVCNYVLALEGEGKYTLTTGNYDDYIAKSKPSVAAPSNLKVIKDPYKISAKEQRQNEKNLKTLEKQIENMEVKIRGLEQEFADPEFYIKNPDKYHKKAEELEKSKAEMEVLMQKWEELAG
jgi:ABC transport system ATP-binding/permease protein